MPDEKTRRSPPTYFHSILAELIEERRPPHIEVRLFVTLSVAPKEADLILLQRDGIQREDEKARTLKGLWRLLPRHTLLEYKSPARPPQIGEMSRLLGYCAEYYTIAVEKIGHCSELAFVLMVPSITPTLVAELARFDWTLEAVGIGYHRISSAPYVGFLVVVDDVAAAERDELLSMLGHSKIRSEAVDRWLVDHYRIGGIPMEHLEGYEELKKALERMPPELRMTGISAEERLSGIAAADRLKGLPPGQEWIALSDESLRRLPDELIATLPEGVRAEIQRRLAH